MEKLTERISQRVMAAFSQAGYSAEFGEVTVSNRPDLCEYQCNGAMKAAKAARKAPLSIAQEVAQQLQGEPMFETVEAAAPGFLNLKLAPQACAEYLEAMRLTPRFGAWSDPEPKTVVMDYGGPNVAKPLHIGHLRSAIIGESVKRIYRFCGDRVIGDIHLGDWGLQMGLIIAETQLRHPELPYFDPDFAGEYPAEPPFTLSELEEIYPAASAKSKVDEAFAQTAHNATFELQAGRPGYRALWKHIMALSVADLKKNYANLNVDFDVWYGESDAQPYIQPMLEDLKAKGLATVSEDALVMEVAQEGDTKEVPPCILVKSDGATLYATSDLATMVQRMGDFHPDKILYVVDKRQSLHFEQVFRAARKSGIVPQETALQFLGFGTMNGKDGKPFKTREGGVMRLETLISDITDFVHEKVKENQIVSQDETLATAKLIAMAALKYGDLSNQPSKDYIFDMGKFAAFEGNTGPYLLYTIVRIKSILARYGADPDALPIRAPQGPEEKELMLALSRFSDNLAIAYRDNAPNVIAAYLYELSGAYNKFYHEVKILTEPDEETRAGYIALIRLTQRVLEQSCDLLGFSAPEKM